ncbi:MAG TPA: complex I NDUFA9 subunit family protein [Gemmataceae bacterium]|nr:complex I NDUFA9 subunit family protein [Gemmataceae bacterium]
MTSRLERGSLVTVFGGAGFLGRHAVRALAADGWRVRAATRRPDLAGHLQPMGAVGQIHPVQANLRYPDSVRFAVEGADVVVNLVGILAECRLCFARSARQTFHAVHVAGARAAARAAREAGAKTFVHVSAIGADRKYWARYAQTKAAGEAAVLAEFPSAVILRPSLMFGPEDQLFNRFAAMASLPWPLAPFLPLIGGGKTRFQPVYVGDVAAAIAAACAGKAKARGIYELGGPDIVTFRQILDMVQEWSGRRRWYLRLPFWLAQIGAFLTWPLPHGLRPLTVDRVRMLMRPNVVSEEAIKDGRTLAGLGIDNPNAMASIVPAYLERFQPQGQFASYRG